MLLQNTLDLSTFEIVRFRIWNQTSQPSDRGFGSKYFNTNSGHEAYCREEIFTPIGWRTAAYMDDIDKINEKLDLIFGDELDTDTIIDSWKEVQDFLAGIEDTKTLMTMLDGKLDKTGGTIQGDNNIPLTISQPNDGNTWIKFANAYRTLGYIGFSLSNGLAMMPSDGSKVYSILHSGNVGDYALKVDGSNLMNNPIRFNTASVDYNDVGNGFTLLFGSTVQNAPNNKSYGRTLSVVEGQSGFQLGIIPNSPNLYFRGKVSGTWDSDWKTIAFTDSTVEAANRLANKVSLWGNTFDGTEDISGTIRVKDGENWLSALGFSDSVLHLGYGTRAKGLGIWGTPIDFFANGTKAMTITEEGNVLVGNATNALEAKFFVNGKVQVNGASSANHNLGSAPTSGLVVGYSEYGISQWITGSGQGNIQVGRFDGPATAYALNLNPLGGAVNVGEGGLNVATYMTIGDSSTSAIVMKRGGYNYIWAPTIGAAITLGVGTESPASTEASLSIYSDRLIPEKGNNTVSLGTSSYRWSNVYSVGGNFSGRVLIGGTTDDGESALQVNGAIALGSNCFVKGRADGLELLGTTNEFMLEAGTREFVFVNYHKSSRGYAPKIWNWLAGSPTEYADFVLGHATFNGGALIPTGQTLTIGSVTIKEVATGEIEVNGNLHTTGTLASGGKGEVGENTTGNAMVYQYDLASGESVYTVDNVKGSTNVIVQIFEWNSNTSSWDMILTDVSVKADAITVTFGRTTTVNHMVTVC